MDVILEAKNISKNFLGVQALRDVSLRIHKGEMHSLVGQNGAGKSTLMKILAGNYRADSGTIEIDGKAVVFDTAQDAMAAGIAIVYQELSLLNNLTVADNIFLGRERMRGVVMDQARMEREAAEILAGYGIKGIDVGKKVGHLSLAQKQLVEIAKALSVEPSILILDEPTAALTDDDTERLFAIIDRLRERGKAVIFISHRIKEITRHCDNATVLMNGKVVARVDVRKSSDDELIHLMLGNELEKFMKHGSGAATAEKEVRLNVENLCVGDKVRNVSFELRKGEIVGVTGLLGAGQNEMVKALFGMERMTSGRVTLDGREAGLRNPAEAISRGVCLLTDNRKEEGLFLEMSVADNITINSLGKFRKRRWFPFLSLAEQRRGADEYRDKLNVVTSSLGAAIKFLSGGNMQKAIIARWLLKDLDTLIFIEPTRGVDVGAKAEIYRHLHSLAAGGKSIIVVSADTAEILAICDRILVMYKGGIVGALDGSATEAELLEKVQGKGVDD